MQTFKKFYFAPHAPVFTFSTYLLQQLIHHSDTKEGVFKEYLVMVFNLT